MSYTLTNPIFPAKVVSYERLAYSPKGVWFREYELFPTRYALDEWELAKNKQCYNIRNIEIYDVLIDLTKPGNPIVVPDRVCNGCGKHIDGDHQVVMVDGKWYCSYDCYCDHRATTTEGDSITED